MEHTSIYTLRRLELFEHGQQSNYYWNIPVYTLLVPANQTESFVQLLKDFGERIWNIDRPHVIQNAVREAVKDQYYVSSIKEAQERFTLFLKQSANREIWPCESADEIQDAKQQESCKIICNISNGTCMKKSGVTWLTYPISQVLLKVGSICMNVLNGKYFEVIENSPYLRRWPSDQLLDTEQFAGAGQFEITVKCNTTEAKFSIDNGKTWHSVSTIYRVPIGSYTLKFSDLENYKTPSNVNVVITNKNASVKVVYKILHNVTFTTSQEENSYVRQIGTSEWHLMPCTLSLEEGNYSFEFSEVEHYKTPEIIDLNVNSNKEVEVRYEQIFYLIVVDANVLNAKATIGSETKNLPAKFSIPYGIHTVTFSDVSGYKTPDPIQFRADSNREMNILYKGFSLDIRPNLSGGYCRIGEDSSFPIPKVIERKGGIYVLTFTPPPNCKAEPAKITVELMQDSIIHPNFVQVDF